MKNQDIKQSEDIIKTILDARADDKSAKKIPVDVPKEFTTPDFFLDNNPHGLMTKETFKYLMDNLSERNIKELHLVIGKLNASEYFEFSPVPNGTGPIPMLYAYIGGWRGRENFKIPAVDNVAKFLSHYKSLRFQCNFSFEELYNSVK